MPHLKTFRAITFISILYSNIYTLIPSCGLIVLQLLDLNSFLKRLVCTFFKYKNSDDREMTKCNSSHFQIS